jgi:F-type H+-transporting ATPase subunit b
MLAIAGVGIAVFVGLGGPAHAEPAGHAEEECIELLEGGSKIDDCQEAPNPILPEPNEIIWGSAAFAVLLAIMLWKGVPAVKKAQETREARIRGDLDAAEHAKAEAEGVLGDYRAQLADARAEASRIIEEARQAADQVRSERIAAVETEAAELRARAQEDIRLQSERALADLRAQVASTSIELAEKIVERNLDAATQQSLIDSYINSVGSN